MTVVVNCFAAAQNCKMGDFVTCKIVNYVIKI